MEKGSSISWYPNQRELWQEVAKITGLDGDEQLAAAIREGRFEAVSDAIYNGKGDDPLFSYSHNSVEIDVEDPKLEKVWFVNHYHCPDCDVSWDDEWDCTCNDRCPKCNAEIEPDSSDDATYTGPARKQ